MVHGWYMGVDVEDTVDDEDFDGDTDDDDDDDDGGGGGDDDDEFIVNRNEKRFKIET